MNLTNATPYQIAKAARLPLSLAQTVALKGSGGDPLSGKAELRMWAHLAGLDTGTMGKVLNLVSSPTLPRKGGYRDVIYNCGRQGGKTNILLACEAVSAAMRPVAEKLSFGQSAFVLIIAPKLELCRSAYKAICGLMDKLGIAYTKREAVMEAELTDVPIIVECITADSDSGRSRTCVAVLVDEASKLPTDPNGSVVDTEVYAAFRPSLVVLNGKLVRASTPWLKEGEYFKDFDRAYGKPEGNALALSCSTFDLNPSIDRKQAEAREHDKRRFEREYLALWTESEANYLSPRDVKACIDREVYDRPYTPGAERFAVLDFASRGDENVLGIAHRRLVSRGPNMPPKDEIVVEYLQGWKPTHKGESIDVDTVIREQVEALRRYKISTVWIDVSSRDLLTAAFRQYGIRTEILSVAVQAQADRFRVLKSRIEAGTLRLLDDAETVRQLCNLQERRHSSGRYSYSVPPRVGRDDRVDVLAGLVAEEVSGKATVGGDIRRLLDVSYSHETGVHVESRWYRMERYGANEFPVPMQAPRGTPESVREAVKRAKEYCAAPEDDDILRGIDLNDPQWNDEPQRINPVVLRQDHPGLRFARSMSARGTTEDADRSEGVARGEFGKILNVNVLNPMLGAPALRGRRSMGNLASSDDVDAADVRNGHKPPPRRW